MIRNFVRDRGNQIVLGTFIATFVYCVMVLRTVRGPEGTVFVPSISVTTDRARTCGRKPRGMIYSINHISMSIQATRVIASIGADLDAAIDRLYPQRMNGPAGRRKSERQTHEAEGPPEPPGEVHYVSAPRSGYVHMVRFAALLQTAEKASVVVRIPHPAGHFCGKGCHDRRCLPLTAGFTKRTSIRRSQPLLRLAMIAPPAKTPQYLHQCNSSRSPYALFHLESMTRLPL